MTLVDILTNNQHDNFLILLLNFCVGEEEDMLKKIRHHVVKDW